MLSIFLAYFTPSTAQTLAAEQTSEAPVDADFTIAFVGVEGVLLENIQRSVRLVTRRQDSKRLTVGERRRLQMSAHAEIKRALEPFGYYRAEVTTEFDRATFTLRYIINLNEPVRVQSVDLRMQAETSPAKQATASEPDPQLADQTFVQEFTDWREQFELQPGQVLDHATYERNKKALLAQALKLGFFDARYLQNTISVDAARESANITMLFAPGQRYLIGDIALKWRYEEDENSAKRGIDTDILNSLITLTSDRYYMADDLATTQRNLSAAPFLAGAEVSLGDPDEQTQRVPIVITLIPRKRQAYNFELGAGTDTGVRGSIGYENRRINSQGHNINARFGVSELSRSLIANYAIPRFKRDSQRLNIFASQTDTFSRARQFNSSEVGVELKREQGDLMTTYGLAASRERYEQFTRQFTEVDRNVDLLIPSVQWKFSEVDDLYFPTQGWSATAQLRGSSDALLSDINLMQAEVDLKVLYPLSEGTLKLRLSLGRSLISDPTDLPESLGFLTGGDDSVRGYAFETIGAERNGRTQVAKHAVVAGIEYQHPLRNGLALAAFVDTGDAFNASPSFKTGAGLGLRWRLPFGALRLDLASALDKEGDPLRLHFSFGTDL